MNIAKRMGAAAAAALTIVGGTVAFASSANAAGSWQCRHWTEGTACARTVSNGYDVQWYKQPEAGGAHHVDFSLECTNGYTYGDPGSFWIDSYQTRSYVFAVGVRGSCRAVVTDYTSGKTFYSGYATKLG
ncbi:hypothetical protein [Streptomyces sp. NPDC097981]|uniref:hypothetical protein n=1 Tax=Streptomyces sp. NPDC097981 TaxID=3155428 RepID=UPI003332E4B3